MNVNTDLIRCFLRAFDNIFVEFELNVVSHLKKVKSVKDMNDKQNIAVLFSESIIRAQKLKYLQLNQFPVNQPKKDELVQELFLSICGIADKLHSEHPFEFSHFIKIALTLPSSAPECEVLNTTVAPMLLSTSSATPPSNTYYSTHLTSTINRTASELFSKWNV
uniref:Uncharacterized protein n=1 Tax=Ditylenchus dipsaci TaxID=166011 RepID=A0A915DN86_9BILA